MPSKNIREALVRKFPAEQYAMLFEVRDAAGLNSSRSADAMAISLWPSRGCEIIGFEIKEHRSDWLRELKNPAKAEPIYKYCDRWYILSGGPDVVAEQEVPEPWGFMRMQGSTIRTIKGSPKNKEKHHIAPSFMAAVLKRATTGMIHESQIKEMVEEQCKNQIKVISDNEASARRELSDIKQQIQVFEKESGIKITEYEWRNDRIEIISKAAPAIRHVMSGGAEEQLASIKRLELAARTILESIEMVNKELSVNT